MCAVSCHSAVSGQSLFNIDKNKIPLTERLHFLSVRPMMKKMVVSSMACLTKYAVLKVVVLVAKQREIYSASIIKLHRGFFVTQ